MSGERWCVLLTREPRVDVRGVSKAIAKRLGLPLVDVTTPLRNALGEAWVGLDRDTATDIAAILTGAGQPAVPFAESRKIRLPPALRLVRAKVEPDDLVVWLPKQEPVAIPWASIDTVALGVVRLYEPKLDLDGSTEFKQLVAMDAPEAKTALRDRVAAKVLAHGASDAQLPPQTGAALLESPVGKLPLEYHADLVLRDPAFVVRITEHHFNFEDLVGASNSSLRNFHHLFGMIARSATHAELTPAAHRFLDWSTVESDLFATVREFEAHTHWLVQVRSVPQDRVADTAEPASDDAPAPDEPRNEVPTP